jgi:hypothetical protein
MLKRVLILEAKKLFIKRTLIILLTVLLFSFFFCLDGINDYKMIKSSQKPFQEMEKAKVSMHIHYTFYGIRGVRLLFIPGPLSVIFNDTALFEGMTAHVDTAEKLNISNSFKGKDLFSDSGGYMDYSGVMLLIGAFLALLYGFDATRNRDYLQMLSELTGKRFLILFVILSRILLTNLIIAVLSLLTLLGLVLSGIEAFNSIYLLYAFGLSLVLTFFFLTGAAIGAFRNKPAQLTALPILYFLLVLFIPWLVQKAVYIEAKEGILSIYDFEYKMLRSLMKLEERSFKQIGTWKSGDVASEEVKALVKSGQELEYKKLKRFETDRLNKMVKRIGVYQSLAAIFPTSFYLSTNKELSSKGFHNFIDFYRYAFDMKHRFIKFYIDRKFYHSLPKEGVESFIKGDENMFYGKSGLPDNYTLGLTITFGWIAGLLTLLWLFLNRPFSRSLRQQEDSLKLNFKANKTTVLISSDSKRIMTLLCDLRYRNIPFAYLRDWTTLPGDVRVKWFFSLLSLPVPEELTAMAGKFINTLEPEQKAKILTALLTGISHTATIEYFIFDNFLAGLSDEFENHFSRLLNSLKKGRKVIYISNSLSVSSKIADDVIRFTNDGRSIY